MVRRIGGPLAEKMLSERGLATRRKLLVAGRSVFETSGFQGSRVADIADTAGVAHGSFYTYFRSKEEVFLELASEVLEMQIGPKLLKVNNRRIQTPSESIREANKRYLENYVANANMMRVIDEVSSINSEVAKVRMERARLFAKRAERAIIRWQIAGLADSSIDASYAAVALTSMMSRCAFVWCVSPMRDAFVVDMNIAAEELTRLWVNALGLPRDWEGRNAK